MPTNDEAVDAVSRINLNIPLISSKGVLMRLTLLHSHRRRQPTREVETASRRRAVSCSAAATCSGLPLKHRAMRPELGAYAGRS